MNNSNFNTQFNQFINTLLDIDTVTNLVPIEDCQFCGSPFMENDILMNRNVCIECDRYEIDTNEIN